ncbi:MAG: hypothetical protein OHK0024_36750 [Thalassobaculales bacterium]
MPDWLRDWWAPIAMAVGIAWPALFGWASWSAQRKFVTREDHDAGAGALRAGLAAEATARAELARRVDHLEATVGHLPTRDDIHALGLQLTRVEGAVTALGARIDGLAELLERVDASVQRHEAIFSDAARRKT